LLDTKINDHNVYGSFIFILQELKTDFGKKNIVFLSLDPSLHYFVKNRVNKKPDVFYPIHFYSDSIHLKFILMDLDFNIIYILYILWIGYPFSKLKFLKWIIQKIQFKFSI